MQNNFENVFENLLEFMNNNSNEVRNEAFLTFLKLSIHCKTFFLNII